jgi:hypothetical protein
VKTNPTWETWAKWLGREPEQGTIYHDAVNMRAARQLWEGFQAIVDVAPHRAKQFGTFHSWFNSSYVRSQGLAIRRQVEVGSDVVSLGRLLDRIAKSPNVLSRERYLSTLHHDHSGLGNKFFDSLTSPGARGIDPDMPLAHLEQLRNETAGVRKWIDKEVAHYDPKIGKFSEGLTFKDVHHAIDLIFEVMNHYRQLILGDTVDVGVTMPPWEVVFTVPWIPDEEARRTVHRIMQEHDDRRRRTV